MGRIHGNYLHDNDEQEQGFPVTKGNVALNTANL